jgi:hypothetical protein
MLFLTLIITLVYQKYCSSLAYQPLLYKSRLLCQSALNNEEKDGEVNDKEGVINEESCDPLALKRRTNESLCYSLPQVLQAQSPAFKLALKGELNQQNSKDSLRPNLRLMYL